MLINDIGIVLHMKPLQENGWLVSVLTFEHGLISGYVKRQKKHINVGDICHVSKNTRLEEQLGFMKLEILESLLVCTVYDKTKVVILDCTLSLLYCVLYPNEGAGRIYNLAIQMLRDIKDSVGQDLLFAYTLFEYRIIEAIGFGLDISKCSVSGVVDNLQYISPNTGAVVSDLVGAPYADKLWKLPSLYSQPIKDYAAIDEALIINRKLLQHFWQPHVEVWRAQRLMNAISIDRFSAI